MRESAKLILKMLVIIITVSIFAFASNYITDPVYEERHYASYEDKLHSLQQTRSPTTIFVGGSSVLFGINAEHYELISGQKAINMGLHAIESPDIYLACIEPYIHIGDTIVISFEYTAYNSTWDSYDDAGLYVAHFSREYWKRVPIELASTYFYQQFMCSFDKLSKCFYTKEVVSLFESKSKDVYLRRNINEYGDISYGIANESKYCSPYEPNLTINPNAMNHILNYVQRFENLGAKVYFVFPPIFDGGTVSSIRYEKYFDEIKRYLGDRLLGYPEDWALDDVTQFYDTGYHLTYDSCLHHTEYVYGLITVGRTTSAE